MPLTDFEKRMFRRGICGALICAVPCFSLGLVSASSGWMMGGGFLVAFAGVICLIWYFEAGMDSLRDYGLGEGIANLYGEERAKNMFGDDYMPSSKSSDRPHD